MDNIEKWDRRFLAMAEMVASWSKDPSTKCGAVITMDRRVLSVGFNGFPIGTDDDEAIYADREEKYRRVVHAEVNAITMARQSVAGATLYSVPRGHGPSCERCAGVIIQAGITRIVHLRPEEGEDFPSRWKDSCLLGLEMFRQAGVEIVSYI
jgi:dCMP deaminase